MIDWVIVGTVAFGYAKKKIAETAIKQGENFFRKKVNKIKKTFITNVPADNNQLDKAHRQACLIAMRTVCDRRRMFAGETGTTSLNKIQDKIYGEKPIGFLGQSEKEWLTKAEEYIREQLAKLDKDEVYLQKYSNEKYQTFFASENINEKNFEQFFTTDAIEELRENTNQEQLSHSFVEEMQKDWLQIVSKEFQNLIFNNQYLANKFQIETLLELKPTIDDTYELVKELSNRVPLTTQFQKTPQAVLNLPNLREKIYDRETETQEVLRVMFEEESAFWIIIAPSAFGKTYLLIKVLQNVVNPDGTIKSEHQSKVQKILVIDCRITKTIGQIVGDFSEILGLSFQYILEDNETAQSWLNKHLFPQTLNSGITWLILENFEAWLGADKNYSLENKEIRDFFDALLNGNHGLRILILSQAEPISDLRKKLKSPKNISENLYKGLPEKNAIEYLREEGTEVGLDEIDENQLKEFLARVYYIPQALSSLIGYLHTIGSQGFEKLMEDKEFWQGFDEYENDLNQGERRTKALISKQILSQSEEVKFLLAVFTFFGKPMPEIVLELLFDNKPQATQTINQLLKHRLATTQIDLQGIQHYELHPYFLEQSEKHLINFKYWLFPINAYVYAGKLLRVYENAYYQNLFSLSATVIEIIESIVKFWETIVDIDDKKLAHFRAIMLNQKGAALIGNTLCKEAIILFDSSIKLLRPLTENEFTGKVDLANALLNKGVAHFYLSNFGGAKKVLKESIKIYKKLIQQKSDRGICKSLAAALMNYGNVLARLHKYKNSIKFYDKTIKIRQELLEQEEEINLRNDLAGTFANKANALADIEKFEEARNNYDEAIQIRLQLIKNGRPSLVNELATAYSNKASIIKDMDDPEILYLLSEAIRARRYCLFELKMNYVLTDLMKDYFFRIEHWLKSEHLSEATKDILDSGSILFRYLNEPKLENSIKQQSNFEFRHIVRLVRTLTEEKREIVYEIAGEYGDNIRFVVDGNMY